MAKVLEKAVMRSRSSGVGMPDGPSIEEIRRRVSGRLDPKRRVELGQFMTPWPIARFMASMFRTWPERMSLLDPGAGMGALSEAVCRHFMNTTSPKSRLAITAYEIDPVLAGHLEERLLHSGDIADDGRIQSEIVQRDFVREGAFAVSFGKAVYSHTILNPPYKKIAADSEYRLLLRREGIETVNLYTAFLGLAVALTKDGGEIVAIVPRSFCNGTYFRPFRHWLLERATVRHIHVFESRKKPFGDDDVLQENVIVRFERNGQQEAVTISTSQDATFEDYAERVVSAEEVVKSDDAEKFIHVPILELNGSKHLFGYTLSELGLEVATGPVVDFRVRKHWLQTPKVGSAPLLYTHHFRNGSFSWPREHKKPNALLVNDETKKWLMPKGWYAVTKRFSAKEERRRLVSYVVEPRKLGYDYYGFENHLNVIHAKKQGIEPRLARGVALFLNSTTVDQHFRTFSGHTQVNATDLRAMRFPSRETLLEFGKWAAKHTTATQEQIDSFVESHHG
jgi:adenine-specific DNA-methyltransferase